MISVGDRTKGLGLGFGGGAEMGDTTKVGDGKGCGDDPDISLSYIDEKLQDVLGQFRKCFEGEVSAENLGAKFGGYGSFLPVYQRSPDRKRPRTPQNIHSSNKPRSQNIVQVEGLRTNSLVHSSASLLPSRGSPLATVASTNPLKNSANDYSQRNERMSSAQCNEKYSSGCKTDNYSSQASERSLRVRIKVGSGNLSTQRNAEIYNSLALDISPSVSADGNTLESKGSRESFNPPEECPTNILQIMTSFPVKGNLLLSPLPHDLLCLSEKQKSQGESKHKSSRQVSDDKHSSRVEGRNKRKSSGKNNIPIELKNHVNKDSQNGTGLILKKEVHAGQLADGGLVEDSGIDKNMKRKRSSDIVKGKILKSCVKKRDKPYKPGGNHKVARTEGPTTGSQPDSEALFETGASVPFVKEDWVCCDKCQKWRLLPLGTNPNNLPEKWLCSMLNWLPGMNRCSFSEKETYKALVVSHQLPAPSGGPRGSFITDASFFDRKKKDGVKDVSASTNRDVPVSSSGKNNLQASVRRCSLNGVNRSPLVPEIETGHLSKSGGALEKHRHKQKEKLLEQQPGRDEIKRKRDADPGRPSVSKKAKVDDDWMFDRDKPSGKVASTSSPGLTPTAEGKNRHNDDHLTRSRKRDTTTKPDLDMEPLKRDVGSVLLLQATSSCSKVSGSHNKRTISKEMEFSPVESVSSSPRFLKQHNSVSTIKILDGKDDLDNKVDASSLELKQNLQLDRVEISSKTLLSYGLQLSGRGQSETETRPLHSGAEKESKSSVTDVTLPDDTVKAPKQSGKPEKNQAHLASNGHNVKDVYSRTPVIKDSTTQAGNIALKEGKILKHMADGMKKSGSNAESTSFYFQAALKFLHGASLLESCNTESAKKGEMMMSVEVYSSTAKFCEFCAQEYEKSEDFAAAALAYKLMEVAYMRVIYLSNTNASKDRRELQTALQIVPLSSESPCSSASDVDNSNNPTTIGKASLVNGVGSPQVIGIHNIAARNHLNLSRIFNFAQDVNYAMESSRKCKNAFAAAKSRLRESQGREGLTSVRKALDFSFHHVEELLKLVRLAMEAISH